MRTQAQQAAREIVQSQEETSDSCGKINVILVFLLLTSILGQGIIFSSGSAKHLRAARVSPPQQREPYQLKQKQKQLPHWRLATDCSSYSFDCFASAQRRYKYMPYPFSSSLRKEFVASDNSSESTAERQRLRHEWSAEHFDYLPTAWNEFLEHKDTVKKSPVADSFYLYPQKVPEDEYEVCIDLAVHQNKSAMEQLDLLLSEKIIVPEPDTNMVAFTISNYDYVQDMLHEVFQMMDEVVGFSRKHFFLVAIDQRSAELACKFGYSVVSWKADQGNLKGAVANTKVVLSHDLTKRGIDFFFTEMDVWWIRSPKPNLVEFQNRHKVDNIDSPHIIFSGHQNAYMAPNIGVYAVNAGRHAEEYFRVCLEFLEKHPEMHDQVVLQRVLNNFSDAFRQVPQDYVSPENPFEAMLFSPHEVVADERPMVTDQTLAIHTLNGQPLQAPHGKKMVAKELGVWYGFHSKPRALDGTSDANTGAAGYYDRTGKSRRYIWLDTDLRSNFFSIVQQNRYHNFHVFEWTMAILIAIARTTNRILVLPQVFNADMDAGTFSAWTLMDYSKLAEMVDFRETNFLSNSKAWKNGENSEGIDHWPFESVVNTALFGAEGVQGSISIYVQVSNRSSIVSKKAWISSVPQEHWLDAWIGSLSTMPEFESTEVLLVNPDVFMVGGGAGDSWRSRLIRYQTLAEQKGEDNTDLPSIGRMEKEVLEIYQLLGWCWDEGFRHTANKVSAGDSCYGKGSPGKP